MSRKHIQRGVSKATIVIFGAIVAVLVWLGFEVVPFYYYYYELHNQMSAMARRGEILTDEEIRRRILKDMKKMGIPADGEDLEILRGDEEIEISLAYDEVLAIYYKDKEYILHTFEFDLYVKEKFVGGRQKF